MRVRCKSLLSVIMAVLLLGWSLVPPRAIAAGVEAPAEFPGVHVSMENRSVGSNNVLIPKLEGHPDAALQDAINARLAERLHTEEYLRTLERAEEWGGGEAAGSGIHMEGRALIAGSLLSLVISAQGELHDGAIGQTYITFNVDLHTGQDVALADLFDNAETAFAHLEALIAAEAEKEGFNAYLEHADVLPMPRDNYSVDERGIVVYYPAEQYRLISGTSGAFVLLYYQLEPLMKQDARTETLLALRPAPEEPAAQVLRDIEAGTLPGIPAQLGQPMEKYIEQYRPQAEPDFTLDGPLYLFESPLMQGVRLISPMYPESEGSVGEVIAIRAMLADLYGLRPGVSTLEDAVVLLGEPDATTEVDAEAASDMLMTPGASYWYDSGANRLELHAGEGGVIESVILHAGAQP